MSKFVYSKNHHYVLTHISVLTIYL